jgi:hypothetical protein
MPLSLPRVVLVALVAGVFACRTSIDPDRFAAQARVEGSVLDSAGRPLPGVDVQIHLPAGGYINERMETGSDGRFSVAIDRLLNVPALGSPDTVTAAVVATASGQQYQPLPTGGFQSDSVRVRLMFAPWGKPAQPTSASITLRLAKPR